MKQRVIIFGGRGFVGSEIVKHLDHRYKVITAGRGIAKNHITCSILDDLSNVINKGDVVINLVGLTPVRKNKHYEEIHVRGAKNIVGGCKGKCKRLIHMSALGANPKSDNEYLKTKGLGEEIVKNSKLDVNIFCPSLIFDRGNELVRMMIKMSWARFFPRIPAKVQPVYRRDIAELFVKAVQGKIKERKMEVGGPEVLSIYGMAGIVYKSLGRNCYPIPLFIVKAGMKTASLLNLFSIGEDQIKNLTIDNLTNKNITKTGFSEWASNSKL
jgi:uncharacterized protein YbjT (DUF2867 family)